MNTAKSNDVGKAERSTIKSFTHYFPAIARILMGVPLIVFGLNGFFNFIPPPTTSLPERPLLLPGRWRTTAT